MKKLRAASLRPVVVESFLYRVQIVLEALALVAGLEVHGRELGRYEFLRRQIDLALVCRGLNVVPLFLELLKVLLAEPGQELAHGLRHLVRGPLR